MPFEQVLDGVMRFLNREILSKMDGWQEVVARAVVGRVIGNTDALKQTIISNGLIKTMGVVDCQGNVDVDGVLTSLKREIEKKGSIEVKIPMVGKITFRPEDIDTIRNDIG
jgi:hypothetical protein